MHKCVRIVINIQASKSFLHDIVQRYARQLDIEGLAQVQAQAPHTAKIIVAGTKEGIDNFIDILHKEAPAYGIEHIEVEPFIKDRDFRGIFRIIG